MRCARAGRPASSAAPSGPIDPGHVSAQLPLGPRPPARPRDPRVCSPGPGRPERDPAQRHSPSTSTRRSARPMAWRKEGARHHGYTGVRGYHPLLAVAAGSGDVLMARLREGRAHTARGAAHFLRETIGRVRAAGASGQLTMRADSGFYAHAVVAVCRKLGVRFSITIRQQPSMRRLIEAIPEAGWTPIEYWLAGGADVAETTYTPFKGEQDAASVRLIVRRVKPTPGSQLALFTRYSYHAFITDRAGQTSNSRPTIVATPRSERAVTSSTASGSITCPLSLRRQWRLARGPGDRPQPCSLDGPDRAGRGDRHDQDAPAAALRSRRAAHSLCSSAHAPSAGALALGRHHRRPRPAAGDPAPDLTPLATAPLPVPASASPPPSPPVRTPGQQPSASATNRSRTPPKRPFRALQPAQPRPSVDSG